MVQYAYTLMMRYYIKNKVQNRTYMLIVVTREGRVKSRRYKCARERGGVGNENSCSQNFTRRGKKWVKSFIFKYWLICYKKGNIAERGRLCREPIHTGGVNFKYYNPPTYIYTILYNVHVSYVKKHSFFYFWIRFRYMVSIMCDKI